MSVEVKSGAGADLLTVDAVSKAARVGVYDAAGNAIDSVTLNGITYLSSALVQNVTQSTANSTEVQLNSGAVFTGVSDTTLGIAAIQVMFSADQECTITVEQSCTDPGVLWGVVDTFRALANVGQGRTFQAVGASFRVTVTNNGGSATTTLRLAVFKCPTVEAVPRALSNFGNLRVAIAEQAVSIPTYSAQSGPFTPPATPTDMFILNGSATRVIKVQKLFFSSTQNTAGVNNIYAIKRSTADSAGTPNAITPVPFDSDHPAATATAKYYTANPTLGATVGNIRAPKIVSSPTGAGATQPLWECNFAGIGETPVILRGVAEGLAVNFGGAALPAGLSVSIGMVWTEEP